MANKTNEQKMTNAANQIAQDLNQPHPLEHINYYPLAKFRTPDGQERFTIRLPIGTLQELMIDNIRYAYDAKESERAGDGIGIYIEIVPEKAAEKVSGAPDKKG